MSLINQMLQDLEQRRAQAATPNGSPLAGLAPSGTVTRARSSLNMLLLGAMLALALVTGYLLWTQRVTPQVTVAVAPAVPAPVIEQIVERKAAAPAVENKKPAPVVENNIPAPVVEHTTPAPAVVEITAEKKPVAPELMAEPELAAPEEPPVMEKRELPLTAEQRAQQAFQQAVAHIGRGRQDDARTALSEALEHDPAHQRARETLAALQLNTGRVSEAEATLRVGLALDPTQAALAKLHARILMERGDIAGAIAVLEPALPKAQADADYLALLAATLSRAQRHDEAAQAYERLLRLRPDVGPWWMGLALSLEALGNTAQALSAYEQARRYRLDPKVAAYVDGRIQALRAALPAEKK
jgi:MSHA biogenesis protein MshN